MIKHREDRTPAFTDDDLMPFGKHVNLKMQDVPAKYLLWLWDSHCSNKMVDNYIHNNLEHLLDEHKDYILGRKS